MRLEPFSDPVVAVASDEDAVWELDGNVLSVSAYARGDVEAALAASAHVVEEVFQTQRIEHAFLEPESTLAVPTGDGGLYVYSGGQGVWDDRNQVASVLGIDQQRVTVELVSNGGAFGGKATSPAPAEARRLADQYGVPVLVLHAREDTVRDGPKRPPVAAGVDADGRGVLRVVRTPGIADAVARVAPDLAVEEVDVPGPPTSANLRAAGWAEAVALLAAARGEVGLVTAPDGGTATAEVDAAGIRVTVRCGQPLDATVLRSYSVGAAHMGWSWVTAESLAVDDEGTVHDLTVRSLGIVRATETPPIEVVVEPDDGPPVNGSDAVFAAVAAATWLTRGAPEAWPTGI